MKVKQLICSTMRLIGREDIADEVETEAESDAAVRLKRALLTYLNAVCDELARGYFPLETQEEMQSESGVYAFADFLKAPLLIKRVTDGKKPVEWHICPNYLQTEAKKIVVNYEYAPPVL
ncbi:MAG: hypothetical protein K2N14_00640, partial [Clostridia bacterium]|nr:hypothetical protein [Clostridia bacterium]